MEDIADALGEDFDSGAYEPMEDQFAPLPAGWYPVEVEKTEVRKNAKSTGSYLWLQLSVIGESYTNRKLFPCVTLVNTGPKGEQATSIGQRELASIGQALGLARITSSEQLLGGQMDVRVIINKEKNRNGEYDNAVKGYAALGAGRKNEKATVSRPTSPPARTQPAQENTPAQSESAPAAGGGKKYPWMR